MSFPPSHPSGQNPAPWNQPKSTWAGGTLPPDTVRPWNIPQHSPTPPGPGSGDVSSVPSWTPTFTPGKFRWMDLVTVVAYIGLFVLGLGLLLLFIPGIGNLMGWLTGSEPISAEDLASSDGVVPIEALFALNFLNYAIMSVLVILSCWRPLLNSFATFKHLWWAKILLIPALWFVSLMFTASLVMILGEPVTSANQAVLEEMTTAAPPLLMVFTTVLMGPLVEEYLFRHLMVGKLSRYINVWVCVVLSVLTFAGIHFLGGGDLELLALIPYLTLSTTITLTYVFFRFSLAYAYVLHVFNNAVAMAVAYLLTPYLEEFDLDQLSTAVAPLLALF